MVQKIVDLRPSLQHSSRSPQQQRQAPRGKRPAPRKPIPLKMRRRRLRIIIGLVGIVVFGLLLYGVHWSSYHRAMRIGEISVRGAMLQDPADVISFTRAQLAEDRIHFIARDNIFAYPKEEIRAALLRNFPRLKSVRVGRGGMFGTTLIVNVDERTSYATWCKEAQPNECYVFDEGGLIFAPASRAGKSEMPYTFFGGVGGESPIGSVFLPDQLAGVRDLLQRMREARFVPVNLHVLDAQDYTIDLTNGFTIKASFGQDIDTLVHNLELVAVAPALRGKEGDLEYIDLRFGNRVYYKFKNVETPEEASQ